MAGFSKTFTSHYDTGGRRDSLAIQSATFNYTYDNLSRLSTLSEGANLLDSFTYADNGLVSNRSESSGTTASTAAYTWDDIGRLTGQTDTFTAATSKNVAWTFPRNPASQIASETRDNDSYAFTGITASTKAYVPNACPERRRRRRRRGLNQYDRVGGATLLYDANGNLTSDPGAGTGGTTYVYDVENRLVQAVSGGATATLTYDPLGRLYQLVKGAANTRFLYDGDAMVTEYNSAGTVLNRYAHGSSAAADDPLVWFSGSALTTKRYLHADHLGSIVAATNGTAAPTVNAYDEYGEPGASNVGRFQYTGQMWLSEIGLHYYKARVYSPYLGRFLQTDPIGYDGGVNLYAYVEDDPSNKVDPTGNDCCYGPQGYHLPPTGDPNSENFGRGSYSYFAHIAAAWRVSLDATGLNGQAAQNRAALITALTNHGISRVGHNKAAAWDIAKKWMLNNQAYTAGRLSTQLAVGLAVGRVAGPTPALLLQSQASTGAIYAAMGRLVSQMEGGRFNTGSLSDRTLGAIAASVGIAGASVNFDAKSGNITATLRADQETGTRMVQKVTICNVNGDGASKC